MIKRNLKQGSDEWLAWRLQGLGASELPIILGEVPKSYGTYDSLLAEKLGAPPKKKNDFIMAKGHETEIKIRAKLCMKYDLELVPTCAEYGKFPFFRTSLDGYHPKLTIEAKYCGGENLNLVTPHHWIQIQGQMAVSEQSEIVLAKSNNGIDVAEIRIQFNSWFWKKALPEVKKFKKKVEDGRKALSTRGAKAD